MRCSTGVTGSSVSSSPRSAASQSAKSTWPFSMICLSSLARSIGIVATAMPPAFITANQQATSIGLLAERSSTRLPGTRPQSFDQHVGDAVGLALQLGVASSSGRRAR